jgi:two-component system cell cycle response regulator
MRIRENQRTATLPVFIMTGKSGAQAMTECFALGADEFFEKPVNPETLARAVTEKLAAASDAAAQHDPATGSLTRAALLNTYEHLRETAPAEPLALALVAVDGLSEALSIVGSEVVQQSLREMALLLRTLLPLSAVTGRWSGGELVCLAPRLAESEIATIIQRALDARHPDHGPGFSAGIASPETRTTLDDLVTEAAAHLSTARLLGGGKAIWRGADVQAPPRCVLFVEEDEVISSLVTHRLRRDGFDVVHTGDGVSAMHELADKHFTLAILETRTPGLDGFSVLERMRSHADTKRTPVIMLSSMGNEQDVVKCFQLGADDYMLKPFSPVELLARVHRLLARA